MPKGSSHLPIQTVRNSSTTLHAPIPLSAMPYTTRIIHLCELPASFPMNRAIIHPQKKPHRLYETHTHTHSIVSVAPLSLYMQPRRTPAGIFISLRAARIVFAGENARRLNSSLARVPIRIHVPSWELRNAHFGRGEKFAHVCEKDARRNFIAREDEISWRLVLCVRKRSVVRSCLRSRWGNVTGGYFMSSAERVFT